MDALGKRDKAAVEPLLRRTRYVPPYRTFGGAVTPSLLIYYPSQGEPAYENLKKLHELLQSSGYNVAFMGFDVPSSKGEVTTVLKFKKTLDAEIFEQEFGSILQLEPSLQPITGNAIHSKDHSHA